ncbi:hypothetical protein F5Y16DRAFT_366462 [Xylariaceae sp. FL0255]|nr:hypothetical protein F5Y16DRAFT_366462 [Xylariaceae sp. FL0255]
MSTTTQTHTMQIEEDAASLKAPTLPPYTEYPSGDECEHEKYSDSSSSDVETTAAAGASTFKPTKQMQLETRGTEVFENCSVPPIQVYTVNVHGQRADPNTPDFIIDRQSSGWFSYINVLFSGSGSTNAPLTRTIFKNGAYRHAIVEFSDPVRGVWLSNDFDKKMHEPAPGSVEIMGRSWLSRSVRFEVPGMGVFGWRYEGAKKEKASWHAKNLMVFEMFPTASISTSTSSGAGVGVEKEKEHRSLAAKLGFGKDSKRGSKKEELANAVRVAQLVRNEEFRTPGSSRNTAGNGGRLMLDLDPVPEKAREKALWMIISTCNIMLKLEVDRRQAAMAAAIS